jgi:hypothetical protein
MQFNDEKRRKYARRKAVKLTPQCHEDLSPTAVPFTTEHDLGFEGRILVIEVVAIAFFLGLGELIAITRWRQKGQS